MATSTIPRIKVQDRQKVGTRYAGRLRKEGRMPAVIYGQKAECRHVSVDFREVSDLLLLRRAHIVEVDVNGEVQPCLIKDVQWNHLGSEIMHVDLSRVSLTDRVRVRVQLTITGEAPGQKEEGAVLEHPISQIEVEALATQIPETVVLDVSDLKVGQVKTVADLKLPPGVTAVLPKETVLASITIVLEEVVEVAPVEGAAAGAEPEVIGKKPEEGEEAAEGEAGAKKEGGAKKDAAPKKDDKK